MEFVITFLEGFISFISPPLYAAAFATVYLKFCGRRG